EQQVFILWSISQGKPVSMLQYLKESLFDVRNDSKRGPNLGHVVAQLAEYFRVQIDEPKMRAKYISKKDLSRDFLIDDTTPLPVHRRDGYKAYCREMGLPIPDAQSQPAAGTSTGHTRAASHHRASDDSESDAHPEHDTYQPPPLMDRHPSTLPQQAPVWFPTFEARYDENQTRNDEQNWARWTAYTEQNEA
ncbi:Unknown protein, partial [Striga hermonthica]